MHTGFAADFSPIASRRVPLARLIGTLVLAVLAPLASLPAHARPMLDVERGVEARSARGESVDVLILLDDAQEREQIRSAVGALAGRNRISNEEYAQFSATLRMQMRALKDRVLQSAAEPDLQVLTDYDHLPVVHARIRSARALQNLRRQGRIKSIDPIVATRPVLTQSLAMIHQPEVAATGHVGTGGTVAVLDTGVDYGRAAFGNCAAPGGNCKVAVAGDFATQDNALDANGHGTNVAGIVLGVAPGARIAALDVFESNGLAYSNAIIAAINWCIANRATYNIVAINMSLGGGQHSSPLAPTDAWGTSIANAVNAGIVVVAASGNNGYTSALSSPAAYSNVVSVGAMYDSNMGGMGWSTCTDASTAAGKVTCFSNSASFLTMVAPGALINAAGLTQGGTSQASPHVAGAVAVLRADYPNDTVSQTVQRLKLGAGVRDARNGITVPGLDLMASLAIPPATYRLTVAKVGNGTGTVSSDLGGVDCGNACVRDISNGAVVKLSAVHGANSMFTGWTGACAGSAATCTVTMSAARSVSASFVARTSEDLVASGAIPAGWAQAAGSSAAWQVATGGAFVGTQALRAGTVGHGQTSGLTVSGRFADGVVSFARRVSSEAGADVLSFYIDDQLKGAWSGEVAWGMVSYPIAAGDHTLKWVYAKNGSGSAGSDSAWIDSVHLPYAAANRRSAAYDFDGDGRADLLWRHAATGANVLWLMGGPIRQDGSASLLQVADRNWTIVGTGDFDGDGRADVLWRHATTGQNILWRMNGTVLSSMVTLAAVPDLNWRVVGVADFDGDGKADILWRHAATGQNIVWRMDGGTRLASTTLAAVADLRWVVVGSGDFDGDGKSDILWRHAASGQNILWRMDGATRRDMTTLPLVADLRWAVAGLGDFDGDGKADILWRHAVSGQNTIWLMDGVTRRSQTFLETVADAGWRIVGVADLDADGKDDIVWRHAGTGRNILWTMNGTTRLAMHWLEDVADLNWRVASP